MSGEMGKLRESPSLRPIEILVFCILLATLSAEHDFPGTSFFLHEAIDAGDIPCIDLRAQCSGFLFALQMADA